MSQILQSKKRKPLWREYGEALLIALVLAFFIRTFVVQSFKIPSESMLQTLQVGDYLLATKFTYGLRVPFTSYYFYEGRQPERGDIIIFEYPKDPSVDFIKRVVGLPGDVIEVRNKQFYRNGEPVSESYVQFTDPHRQEAVRDNYGPVTVPPGKYFVMGDNRDNSMDSRFWGFVDKDAIRAKAWRIYWSWGGFDDIRWDRLGKLLQ
ncbi:MAG: signal peptidase I [Desulfovibrio sp.]|nr:signal peptidase I [Desulfovibrio sp.]